MKLRAPLEFDLLRYMLSVLLPAFNSLLTSLAPPPTLTMPTVPSSPPAVGSTAAVSVRLRLRTVIHRAFTLFPGATDTRLIHRSCVCVCVCVCADSSAGARLVCCDLVPESERHAGARVSHRFGLFLFRLDAKLGHRVPHFLRQLSQSVLQLFCVRAPQFSSLHFQSASCRVLRC